MSATTTTAHRPARAATVGGVLARKGFAKASYRNMEWTPGLHVRQETNFTRKKHVPTERVIIEHVGMARRQPDERRMAQFQSLWSAAVELQKDDYVVEFDYVGTDDPVHGIPRLIVTKRAPLAQVIPLKAAA